MNRTSVALVITALVVAYFWFGGQWPVREPNLDGRSTAYDYLKASVEVQANFRMNMCYSGACLPVIDWRCGFGNGGDRDVDECFDLVVRQVETWEKLDRIRKYCGVKSAEFVGLANSIPDQCKKEGGTWGVKSSVMLDRR